LPARQPARLFACLESNVYGDASSPSSHKVVNHFIQLGTQQAEVKMTGEHLPHQCLHQGVMHLQGFPLSLNANAQVLTHSHTHKQLHSQAFVLAQIALKAADLCNLCDPHYTHIRWVAALEEEFFLQGDAERQLGLPVTPLFDRSKPGVSKSQVAFMDVVAVPLFRVLAQAFPGTEPLLKGVSYGDRTRLVLVEEPMSVGAARLCLLCDVAGICSSPPGRCQSLML
jgi:hypothetical protein